MCLKPNKMEIKKKFGNPLGYFGSKNCKNEPKRTHWVILVQKTAKTNPNEPTGLFGCKKQKKKNQKEK